MESQVITWATVTTVLGVVLPPFLALVKRTGWHKRTKDLVILALLIVIGGIAGFLVGDVQAKACSGVELSQCVSIIVAYIGATVVQAMVWYKMYWEDSAIENKVAGIIKKA